MRILEQFDDFLSFPTTARELGLRANYNPCDFLNSKWIYSGLRSNDTVDENLKKEYITKIENKLNVKLSNVTTMFHVNPGISYRGFPHIDEPENHKLAALIYLSPNPSLDSGTTVYENSELTITGEVYRSMIEIVYNITIPDNNYYKQECKQALDRLRETLIVKRKFENKFNSCLVYNQNLLHAPDYYFGSNLLDSRLTLLLFAEMI